MYLSKENQHQLLAAIPVIFNEFIMGFGYGWTAPTLRLLQDDPTPELTVSLEQSSWIASLHEFGRLCGPLICRSLLCRMGRKGVLALSSIMFFITYALIAFTRSVPVIYAARWIFGIAVGINDVSNSIYLSENFTPTFRGMFGSIATACFFGAFLIEVCMVNFLSYDTVAYANALLAFLALINIIVSTETPHFLVTKGKYEQALKNFLWLRGKDSAAVVEISDFEKLKQRIEEERKETRTIMTFLSNPVYRKTITLVTVFCLLTVATGSSAVTSFVSIAFTEGVFTPNEYTILFAALQFSASFFGSTIIEKVNRRTILIISLLITMMVHAITAALFYLEDEIHIPYFSWWIFATITAYSMMYSFSILPIFYSVRGELLPQNIRPFGGSVAIMGHGLIGFVTIEVFLFVDEMFGMYWNFVFYAFMSLVSVLFVYFSLPETRGKSLAEIQSAIEMKISRQK